MENNFSLTIFTSEEREEICRVVDELESVNSRELIDFTSQENATANPRHKLVSPAELDRLANKNSSDNTLYQTKWATTVMKGKKTFIFSGFSTKHDIMYGNCDRGEFPKFTFSVTVRYGTLRAHTLASYIPKESLFKM